MIWLWAAFIILVLGMLALDLGVLNRKAHVVTIAEAMIWTLLWVVLSLVFNIIVYYIYKENWFGVDVAHGVRLTGRDAAVQFLTGYVIEKSLSLDNIFVFAVIFTYFGVPAMYQHRVLFWGILGALVMRGIMIGVGAELIHRFHWMIYVFGGLLLITAVKLLLSEHENVAPERNPLVRLARRIFPVTDHFEADRFFTRINARRAITPLFLVLLVVESSDVLFAVDSIPAIFAVTRDPFLIFTSNVFAILGLRSLYFVLAGFIHQFRYLRPSLVFVLAYVGVKMLVSEHWPIPTLVSLVVITGILSVGIIASLVAARTGRLPKAPATPLEELSHVAEYAWKQVRRALILLVGATILLVGVAMLALPGPGLLTIIGGLAILATEFVWARRLLIRMKENAVKLAQKATGRGGNAEPPRDAAPQTSDDNEGQ